MSLQPNEVLIIVVVALIVLGPQRLPGAIRSIGRAFRQVRDFSTTVRQEIDATLQPPVVEPASPPPADESASTQAGDAPVSTQAGDASASPPAGDAPASTQTGDAPAEAEAAEAAPGDAPETDRTASDGSA